MANALTDFIRKRDFLVCMDSDGCVMDTVRIKHCSVFCPELIRVFGLEAHTDFITTAWEEINLNSITRGISRFESAVLIFDRLKNRGIDVPGSEDIAAWVSTASELSTASLQQEVLRTQHCFHQPDAGSPHRAVEQRSAGRLRLAGKPLRTHCCQRHSDRYTCKRCENHCGGRA